MTGYAWEEIVKNAQEATGRGELKSLEEAKDLQNQDRVAGRRMTRKKNQHDLSSIPKAHPRRDSRTAANRK